MVLDGEAVLQGYGLLADLDGRLEELHHLAAAHAHQVVVVSAPIQLEDRLAALEVVACDQTRTLELGQDPIDRRQAHVVLLVQEGLVDLLRTQVAPVAVLEHGENLEPGACDLEPCLFDVLTVQLPLRREARRRFVIGGGPWVMICGQPAPV